MDIRWGLDNWMLAHPINYAEVTQWVTSEDGAARLVRHALCPADRLGDILGEASETNGDDGLWVRLHLTRGGFIAARPWRASRSTDWELVHAYGDDAHAFPND